MTTDTRKEIRRDQTIAQIFADYPQHAQKLAQELARAGLNCVGCQGSNWETLEAGFFSHGGNEEALLKLIGRLNNVLAESFDLSTVGLTERAAKKFAEICAEEGKAGWGMRLEEVPAGCSGYEHHLDFCEAAEAGDETFTHFGVSVFVKQANLARLRGSVIDFVEGLNGAGFKVSNPNVKSSCGCGTSHSY